MTGEERLAAGVLPLLEWYHEHRRILPWREEPTPYRVWVSEIMLQQTRVTAVLGYFARFMEAFPDAAALADAPNDLLMKQWQGLGYYSRARNLKKAAGQIMERFGGEFPRRYEDIRSLAGVGDYTAGAIASIAFREAVPAVDGNVLRVLARLTGNEDDISRPEIKRRAREVLTKIIPRACPGDYNQALMELGAMVCLPNGAPLCSSCPLKDLCAAFQTERTEVLPVRSPKKARRIESRRVYLIFFEGRIALRQRAEKGLLAGLWEYPNELADSVDWPTRWGLRVEKTVPAGRGKHIFTHIEWHMEGTALTLSAPDLPEGWVLADLQALRDRYAVPNAFAPFRGEIENRLRKWGLP